MVGKEAGCISAFSIHDPQCDFTPHIGLLGIVQRPKKHSCIRIRTLFVHPYSHTSVHSAPLYMHCYSSQTLIQLPPAAHSVTAGSLCSAEAVIELRRAEQLINIAAQRSHWLGMVERSICPRGLGGPVRPCRRNDRLVPSGQRATDTSIA